MKIKLGKTLSGKDVLFRQNALTTHATVIGMTGSGKSGMLLGMVEELANNKVPTILVDIKGDMTNIALQDNKNVVFRCLTPGGTHGEPVNVFANLNDPEAVSEAASALLRIAGLDPDPLQSRAHAYLATILQKRHAQGQECDLISIVRSVQEPNFNHLGAMDLDVAFPKRSRLALATKLNNILIAPAFQAWREGLDLNMDDLFCTNQGRTSIVIYSVAHLVDEDEQNFALSLLFNEMLRWTREQEGTSDLRACMIIDECVGLLPPHPKNPPTKKPIMLLLKQARGFGVGIILATQNPVDLDYKAQSNCSTWMVGRLSMEKDRARVIKGMCANTTITPAVMEAHVSKLQSRQFVVVRPSGATTVYSRDVNCDLRGPMSSVQIRQMFNEGRLEAIDVNASLRQQLHLARKELQVQFTPECAKRIATLEQQLNVFKSSSLRVINGGK